MRCLHWKASSDTVKKTRALSIILLAAGLMLSPTLASAANITGPASVSAVIGDDNNTSTLNPYPLIPISSITYAGNPALNGQCTWINTGLNNFIAANPNDGSGPSGAGWSYTWAGVAQEAAVEKGLALYSYTYNGDTYNGYNPWVGTQPSVKSADGSTGASGITNAEVGGAVINLKYTVGLNDAPAITNLHWIQAYTGTLYGNAFGPILDNDPAHPYSAQASNTPFYDVPYAAGTLADGGWFRDRPYVTENEYELNPVVSSQFQVVLVGDTTSQTATGPGGAMVTQHALTLYGGYWWGYEYTAADVPEPSSIVFVSMGFIGFAVTWSRRRSSLN